MENETKKAPEMTEAAKAARKLYNRAWAHANKEKRKAISVAFWERRARELISEGILTMKVIDRLNGKDGGNE